MNTVRCLSDNACDTMEAQSEGCANTPRTLTRTPVREVDMATRHFTHARFFFLRAGSAALGVNSRAAGAAATGGGADGKTHKPTAN